MSLRPGDPWESGEYWTFMTPGSYHLSLSFNFHICKMKIPDSKCSGATQICWQVLTEYLLCARHCCR